MRAAERAAEIRRVAAIEGKGLLLGTMGLRGGRLLSVLLASMALLASAPAWSQALDLPPELSTKTGEFTAEERRQLQAYIAEYLPALSSDKPETRHSARQKLRQPLRNANVSVSFRLAYSAEASPGLRAAIDGTNPEASLLALLLAGDIATDQTAQLAVAKLASPNADVRYQAAFALGLTFRTVAAREHAITDMNLQSLVQALAGRIKGGGVTDPIGKGAGPFAFVVDPRTEETDPFVMDRVIRSLGAAATIAKFPGVRNAAVNALCVKMAQRIRTEDARNGDRALVEATMRAAEAIQVSLELAGEPLTVETFENAAAFGTDCVSFAVALAEAGHLDLTTPLCSLGENVAFYGRGGRTGRTPTSFNIARALGNDDLTQARTLQAQLVSELTGSPFGFSAGRFRFN